MSDVILTTLSIILLVAWAPLAFAVGYLLMLAAAAARPLKPLAEARHQRRFRIVIPAHNEALVLEPVLRRLLDVRYPRQNYEIVVVADNCTDQTAQVARSCGARVLERFDPHERGKGHALAYAFASLRAEVFDAYIVLDADTLVKPDLLAVMNRYLEAGHRVVQAHYDVLNPFESKRTALMYVAFKIFTYVRPLGRRLLGLSAGLNGNGMCFAKAVIDSYAWNAYSLAEDIEYTTTLVLNGERVVFAPEACIAAQMPTARTQAVTQRMRWEAGRLELARRSGPRLLLQGIRRFDRRVFDWGMDLVIPPLAALTLLVGGGTLAAAVLATYSSTTMAGWIFLLWGGLVVTLSVFVVAALAVGRVPGQAYLTLLHAPAYVAWKLWLYIRMSTSRAPKHWIRTERTEILDQ